MIQRPGLEQLDPGAVPNGTYSLTIVGGTITGLQLVIGEEMPLTTEIGGVPDLVWDTDNQLVLTEVL